MKLEYNNNYSPYLFSYFIVLNLPPPKQKKKRRRRSRRNDGPLKVELYLRTLQLANLDERERGVKYIFFFGFYFYDSQMYFILYEDIYIYLSHKSPPPLAFKFSSIKNKKRKKRKKKDQKK